MKEQAGLMQDDNIERLNAIGFFANELRYSMQIIRGRSPTKKAIIDNLDQWINTIETIKQISEHNGVE